MHSADYNNSVFINCPFDKKYLPILHAIIFTIYRCGFVPQCALGEDNALDNRLEKIEKCIESCRYGVHDISRIELTEENLPKFNMPFELGIFFGAKRFGGIPQTQKNALIFDREKDRYVKFISNLRGVDIKAHNDEPVKAIREIRNWLKTSSIRKTIPGYNAIIKEYENFEKSFPDIVQKLNLDIEDMPFNDFCVIVEEFLTLSLG